jgi:hypothetical protein
MRIHLAAAFLTAFLFAMRVYGVPCPTETDGTAAVEAKKPVNLPVGCVAPYDGKLYNRAMRDIIHGRLAAKDAALAGTKGLLDQARLDLATCRDKAATALDDCSTEVPVVVAPTSRASGWVWAVAGSGAVFTPLVGCHFADCGSEATPWVAAAGGAAVVALLAWLVE